MWYIRGWVHFLCIKDPKWVGVMYRGGGGRLHRPARLNDRARTLGLWGSTAILLWAFQVSMTSLLQNSTSWISSNINGIYNNNGLLRYGNTLSLFTRFSWACSGLHHRRLYLLVHVYIISKIPLMIEEAPPHKHCWHSLHYWHCLRFLCAADTAYNACMLLTLLTQLNTALSSLIHC